ncbi:MAG TPA: hypothetical protein VNZ44_15700, partial [Pyrinomonadaceae bacterium]|nr:hypothetical protein [Pyrinomonadaceae bacterium]
MIKLFQKRVEWKPVRGSFGPAGRSAFRVLGLQATASQREVFDAAAAVRLALKLGVRKTFEGDLGWLGEVARGETEVRDAVGRLSAPAERARERLLWFHGRVTNRPVSTVAELMRTVDSVLHDAAGSQGASGDGRSAATSSDQNSSPSHRRAHNPNARAHAPSSFNSGSRHASPASASSAASCSAAACSSVSVEP